MIVFCLITFHSLFEVESFLVYLNSLPLYNEEKKGEVHPNFYGQLTQYKEDLELMLKAARAYVISKTSGGSINNIASPC